MLLHEEITQLNSIITDYLERITLHFGQYCSENAELYHKLYQYLTNLCELDPELVDARTETTRLMQILYGRDTHNTDLTILFIDVFFLLVHGHNEHLANIDNNKLYAQISRLTFLTALHAIHLAHTQRLPSTQPNQDDNDDDNDATGKWSLSSPNSTAMSITADDYRFTLTFATKEIQQRLHSSLNMMQSTSVNRRDCVTITEHKPMMNITVLNATLRFEAGRYFDLITLGQDNSEHHSRIQELVIESGLRAISYKMKLDMEQVVNNVSIAVHNDDFANACQILKANGYQHKDNSQECFLVLHESIDGKDISLTLLRGPSELIHKLLLAAKIPSYRIDMSNGSIYVQCVTLTESTLTLMQQNTHTISNSDFEKLMAEYPALPAQHTQAKLLNAQGIFSQQTVNVSYDDYDPELEMAIRLSLLDQLPTPTDNASCSSSSSSIHF